MPKILFFSRLKVDFLSQSEEIVAQTVDISEQKWVHFAFLSNNVDATLGSPTDGATDMSYSSPPRSTGENEPAPTGLSFFSGIDSMFYPLHIVLGNTGATGTQVFVSRCKLGTDDKELVLDGKKRGAVVFIGNVSQQQTKLGIKFIDSAIGLQTGVGFRYALSSNEAGSAIVAHTCVKMTFVHTYYIYIKVCFVLLGGKDREKQHTTVRFLREIFILFGTSTDISYLCGRF
jgi:hypothetical protein